MLVIMLCSFDSFFVLLLDLDGARGWLLCLNELIWVIDEGFDCVCC